MASTLASGESVLLATSRSQCRVQELIGAGGQGEVYKVVDENGRKLALKWYYPYTATERQRELLSDIIKTGAPDSRFLWPLDLAIAGKKPGFGYVMELRGPQYQPFVSLMNQKVAVSLATLSGVGLQLAESFLSLHSAGLCYRDISFGNVFFDPDSASIMIVDNDNVGVDGKGDANVRGTVGFMAPEIIRHRAPPSAKTDLFALAVLLFYLFVINHPFEGKREASIRVLDQAAQHLLYVADPIFIFDPKDESNRPVPGVHDNALILWPLYPSFLRRLFTRSFTEGVNNPDLRVRESEWRQAMLRLRDSIFACRECGRENFFDPDLTPPRQVQVHCWSCNTPLVPPLRLHLGNRDSVMLDLGARLYPHHLLAGRVDFSKPVAEVVRHPSNPGINGLRNLSSTNWTASLPDGNRVNVPPQRAVTLVAGTHIDFGIIRGNVQD
jgi:serine/threonine protein kinase